MQLPLKIGGAGLATVGALTALPLALHRLGITFDDFLAAPRAVLVWPVTTLILGLVLLLRYRGAIDHVIRFGHFKLPGGVEIQSQQPAESNSGPSPEGRVLSPEQEAQLTGFIENLERQSQQCQQHSKFPPFPDLNSPPPPQ